MNSLEVLRLELSDLSKCQTTVNLVFKWGMKSGPNQCNYTNMITDAQNIWESL